MRHLSCRERNSCDPTAQQLVRPVRWARGSAPAWYVTARGLAAEECVGCLRIRGREAGNENSGGRRRVLTIAGSHRRSRTSAMATTQVLFGWSRRYVLYVPSAIELVPAVLTPADDVTQQQEEQAKRLTSQAADRIGKSGLVVETVVRRGDPRTVIVDEANEWGANLIVMGSHGRTGSTRLLLGSVAQAVVGHAPCSVEVVRHTQARFA